MVYFFLQFFAHFLKQPVMIFLELKNCTTFPPSSTSENVKAVHAYNIKNKCNEHNTEYAYFFSFIIDILNKI